MNQARAFLDFAFWAMIASYVGVMALAGYTVYRLDGIKVRINAMNAVLDQHERDHRSPAPVNREPELAKALTKCQEQRATWEKKARGE